jgi:hypothetical protein
MRLTIMNRAKVLRPASQAASLSKRRRARGQGCRAFGEAEYSALPQITNGEAIISASEAITDSIAPAFATANRDPISGPCTLTYQTTKPPLLPKSFTTSSRTTATRSRRASAR